MFAGIVVNKKATALNRIFHYTVPEDLRVVPGMIVQVPFGREELEGIVVELVATVDFPLDRLKPISSVSGAVPLFGQDLLALSKYIADYYLANWVSVLQGMLPAGMNLTGKMPKSNVMKKVYLTELGVAALKPRGEKQQQVLAYLQQQQAACQGVDLVQLLKVVSAGYATVKSLQEKELLEIREEVFWEDTDLPPFQPKPTLTQEQLAAIAAINQNFATVHKPVLLYGVTGSGKTEVYLHLVEAVLKAGKQVIILVPEIALTPQTIRVFQQRLGARIAVLHSNLTGTERRKSWLGIAEGKFDVVIGARSAIFAPTPSLGLVILDEEHEGSYKQDHTPRFHTRTVAAERCRLVGAQLVLGSATPDLESYYKATQTQEYALVRLPNRVANRAMAPIFLVDMREELKAGNHTIFSLLLQECLTANLKNGKQTMLFLNRRGYESFVSCRHCGYVVNCPHCSVAMSYHLGEDVLKCHYCGQTQETPKICPNCGSVAIRHFGAGTQKIAEAAKKLLPTARIARIDRDSVQQRGSYERIYQQMLAGEIDILVGTQMIAKGLDFPNVTLVGVVAADTTLNLPDFRSGERTFQLITQVAGRAGRHQAGQVIVQTYSPESKILQAIRHQDYQAFYQNELAYRQAALYPPFTKLARVVVSGTDLFKVRGVANQLGLQMGKRVEEWLQHNPEAVLNFWGPKPCPKEKIKDRYRLQLMLKGSEVFVLKELLRQSMEAMISEKQASKEVQIAVDIEPMNMI